MKNQFTVKFIIIITVSFIMEVMNPFMIELKFSILKFESE